MMMIFIERAYGLGVGGKGMECGGGDDNDNDNDEDNDNDDDNEDDDDFKLTYFTPLSSNLLKLLATDFSDIFYVHFTWLQPRYLQLN